MNVKEIDADIFLRYSPFSSIPENNYIEKVNAIIEGVILEMRVLIFTIFSIFSNSQKFIHTKISTSHFEFYLPKMSVILGGGARSPGGKLVVGSSACEGGSAPPLVCGVVCNSGYHKKWTISIRCISYLS